MKYSIHITRAAENDLNEAADYIQYVLMNPQAADDLLDSAAEAFDKLSEFAQSHALTEDPVLRAWGIRFVQIGSYLAFYTISEAEQRVYIIRFLYGKRNWIGTLKGGFSLE